MFNLYLWFKKIQHLHPWFMLSLAELIVVAPHKEENDVMYIETRAVSIKTFVIQTNQGEAATFISSPQFVPTCLQTSSSIIVMG